jgi:thiamine-phosphate pyrophosphorylase
VALRLHPLYAILDTAAARARGWDPVSLARALLAGGARLLQIRAKDLPSGAFLELSEAVVRLARPLQATVVVNDRADLSRLAGAAGVHVGQDDLPVAAARRIVGAGALVGLSTHDEAQIAAGARGDASYLAVGPVFETATKDTGVTAVGLGLVRHAVAHGGGKPIVAIGGITLARAADVVAAGASAAVISDLLATGDPEARVREYVRRLERIAPPGGAGREPRPA